MVEIGLLHPSLFVALFIFLPTRGFQISFFLLFTNLSLHSQQSIADCFK